MGAAFAIALIVLVLAVAGIVRVRWRCAMVGAQSDCAAITTDGLMRSTDNC